MNDFETGDLIRIHEIDGEVSKLAIISKASIRYGKLVSYRLLIAGICNDTFWYTFGEVYSSYEPELISKSRK